MNKKRRFLEIADQWASKLGKRGIAVFVFLFIILLGWLDYVTGFEISFSFFYLFPISIAAWYLGIRNAERFTFLSILTWLVSNWLAGEKYSSEWIRFFNGSVRLIVFLIIVNLLNELKIALQNERQIARTDFLTGIFNRREFIEQLEFEIKRAERLTYPISLAYIDLDNFKIVNDEHGHSAGDEQLKIIAHTIASTVRKTDLFARLGGDEFGLCLLNVDQVNAKLVLEKVNNAVMHELSLLKSPVTLSIGVITFNASPDNIDKMLNKADALMYEAKQSGKKRTVYFEDE
jgi:diguanylate cyclase (GGDEF)-like protein